MKSTMRGVIGHKMVDALTKQLLLPAVQGTGAITGNTVQLPSVPPTGGITVKVWQDAGAVVASGSLVGKVQQCDTSGGSYTDVYSFPASGTSGDHFEANVVITQQFVKYVGTVTGTSIVASAGMLF